ncbi:MAG: methyltransferase domain-containing protein, partial [Candidatus Hodarchaeota archaeon]
MSTCQDGLGDSRSFSWRFFLDLAPSKRVLHIGENISKVPYFISQWSDYVVSSHYNPHNLLNWNQSRRDIQRKNVHFLTCQYHNTPFKNDAFDVVIYESLQQSRQNPHTKREQQILTQAYSVLKAGGQFLLITPNPFFLYNLANRNKTTNTNHLGRFFTYKRFVRTYTHLLLNSGFNEFRLAYFYRGPVGEAYCLYGQNFRALHYYHKNFTSFSGVKTIKRIIHYVLLRLKA